MQSHLVATARSWVGVPYHHQGTTRAGCDCVGLLIGLTRELDLLPAEQVERMRGEHGGYSRHPDGTLLERCRSMLMPATRVEPGRVVVMSFVRGVPQHAGLVADYRHGGLSLVHALSTIGGVREHRLSPQWQASIMGVFRMPGIIDDDEA